MAAKKGQCSECGQAYDLGNILMCDGEGCPAQWCFSCAQVTAVPIEEWYCFNCKVAGPPTEGVNAHGSDSMSDAKIGESRGQPKRNDHPSPATPGLKAKLQKVQNKLTPGNFPTAPPLPPMSSVPTAAAADRTDPSTASASTNNNSNVLDLLTTINKKLDNLTTTTDNLKTSTVTKQDLDNKLTDHYKRLLNDTKVLVQ